MGLVRNCIVIKNENFEVISFDEGKEIPLHVLIQPDASSTIMDHMNKYISIDSRIEFSWGTEFRTNAPSIFKVVYKRNTLFQTQYPKLQVVLDALNKYKNISKENLNKLVQEKKEDEKSSLELEIEKLKDEKQKLIEEAKTYAEFIKKGNELFTLMNELNKGE